MGLITQPQVAGMPKTATDPDPYGGVKAPELPANEAVDPMPTQKPPVGGPDAPMIKPGSGTAITGQSTGLISPPDQTTVAGQMNALLDQNSAYMQNAKTQALQQMNGKGLLNSSMAVGAGQLAAIQSALPIAQQDAQSAYDWKKTQAGFGQQKDLLTMEQTFNERLAKMDDDTRRWVQETSLAAQKELAGMNISADAKKAFLQQQASSLDTYQRMVAQINANPDSSAEIKNKALQDAQAIYQQGIQVAATLAGIDLPADLWTRDDTNIGGGGTPAPNPTPAPAAVKVSGLNGQQYGDTELGFSAAHPKAQELVNGWNRYWQDNHPVGHRASINGGTLTRTGPTTANFISADGTPHQISTNTSFAQLGQIPEIHQAWQDAYGIYG